MLFGNALNIDCILCHTQKLQGVLTAAGAEVASEVGVFTHFYAGRKNCSTVWTTSTTMTVTMAAVTIFSPFFTARAAPR